MYAASGDDQWLALACRNDDERTRLDELTGSDPCDEPLLTSWTVAR